MKIFGIIAFLFIMIGVIYLAVEESSRLSQVEDKTAIEIPSQDIVGTGVIKEGAVTRSTEGLVVTSEDSEQKTIEQALAIDTPATRSVLDNLPKINPVSNASAVVQWGETSVFIDPVGEKSQYTKYGRPDIVVLTHIHPDNLSVETMIGMLLRETIVLAPQSVIDQLPLMISNNTIRPFEPGTVQQVLGITFTAIPAYNIRPEAQQYHPRARGDIGVVMEVDGTRVYFSGDTEGTPEMLALENIDTAVVAMNLPAIVGVEAAAKAVAEFSPRVVVPYHYRSSDSLSDLDEFERILFDLNPNVKVERKDWY